MARRALTLIGLPAALILLLLLTGCPGGEEEQAGGPGGEGGGAPQGPPPVPVVVLAVEQRAYAPAIELTGDMRALQRSMLTAEVGGKVLSIAGRVGDAHPKGRTLIQIDSSTYSAQLASANANLEQARQQLAQLEAGPRGEQVAAQESAVAAAQARYDAALDNLNRQQQLYDEGVVPESTLVAARSQADAAQAALEQERQRLGELQAGSRVEEIAAARARVQAAASQVELAALSLQRSNVQMPFDAVVSQLLVEVGQFVSPGMPLAEVVASKKGDPSEIGVEAWFNVPQERAQQIDAGDKVELRSEAVLNAEGNPVVIVGTVAQVAPAADPVTRQFPVRVRTADQRLRPGMTVRARLLTEAEEPRIMVPADATTQSTLGLVVYKMTPPAAEGELPGVEAVNVTLGEHVDQYIVIEEGALNPGEMVVTRGKEQLYPGAKIIPTNLQQPGGEGGLPGGGGGEGSAAVPGNAGDGEQAVDGDGASEETGTESEDAGAEAHTPSSNSTRDGGS